MPVIDLALVISNPGEDQDIVAAALLRSGLCPIRCSTVQKARTLLGQEAFKLVVCADILPDGNLRAILQEVKKSANRIPVVALSRSADWNSYLKALAAGAFDLIVCPPDRAEAMRIIRSARGQSIPLENPSLASTLLRGEGEQNLLRPHL